MAEPPPTELATGTAPRRAYFWPALVVGLLVTHVLLLAVVVVVATRDRAFAVEPDYCQKALHWDDTVAQQQKNARLRWRLQLALGDAVNAVGERTLTCTLTSPDGQPLDGARVTLITFAHARGTARTASTLAGNGAGRYSATLRFPRAGLWEFRLRAERGPDTFTHVEQRDVYPPGEHRPWRP